jgi:hypothetical protein
MSRKSPAKSSAALASLAAGPIFVVSTALAMLYLELPRSIDVAVDPLQIAPALLMFLPAVVAGFILSIIPNMLGSRLLHFTGGAFPAARSYPVWFGTGAFFGTLIVWATSGFAVPPFAFGIITTSACCAGICRHSVSWD